jgi:hypothetical protein
MEEKVELVKIPEIDICMGCYFLSGEDRECTNPDHCPVEERIIFIKKESVNVEKEHAPSKEQDALTKQEGGSHYKELNIEPVEYIHANELSFFEGNVVKYVTRHKNKKGAEDIRKAIHYLEMILKFEYS